MSLRNKMNRLVDKVTDIMPAWFTECPIGEIEVDRTHVYSAKTGKRLYTLKSVSGFRIAEYKRNIFGVVADGTKPYSTITYGTLDNTWMKSTKQDVEI